MGKQFKTRIEKYKTIRQQIENDINKLLDINLIYEDTICGRAIYSLDIPKELYKILEIESFKSKDYDLLSIIFERYLKECDNKNK